MQLDQRFVFKNYCKQVTAGPQQYHSLVQVHNLRNSLPPLRFDAAVKASVKACNRFIVLLRLRAHYYWFVRSYWEESSRRLIPQAARFLNWILPSGCHSPKLSFITDDKVLCGDCDTFVDRRKQDNHTTNNPGHNVFVSVPSLLPNWSYEVGPLHKRELSSLIFRDDRHHISTAALNSLKTQIIAAEAYVKAEKIEVTTNSILKAYFTNEILWDKCFRGASSLLLNCLTIAPSEAFMETLGSIMEQYHKRFTYDGAAFDDKRLQKEMYIKLNGPPLIECNALVHETYKAFKAETREHTFAHQASAVARSTASSRTIIRVQKESAVNKNRHPCLEPKRP